MSYAQKGSHVKTKSGKKKKQESNRIKSLHIAERILCMSYWKHTTNLSH